ncbi:MAG: ThiS family protein [Desulfobacterales bacterium CG23_combo_of_CG06-09_8_20_14_all_52_9]|nr:MAG: ThiS family protein [Desulfobacterales bacterium CG23_combo_of_CG06-09_8_20_14_all_52_9]
MSIDIAIHKTHRQFAGGAERVSVEGKTVGQCLDRLIQQYPQMKAILFDRKGRIKNTIEIYVNMESAYPDELKKPVKNGDVIHIALMLAGG